MGLAPLLVLLEDKAIICNFRDNTRKESKKVKQEPHSEMEEEKVNMLRREQIFDKKNNLLAQIEKKAKKTFQN